MTGCVSRDTRTGHIVLSGLLLVILIGGTGCEGRGERQPAAWDQYIRAMDDALARDDFYAADLARRTAYLLALGSRRWDALAAVGDANVRFLGHPGVDQNLRVEARRVYRSALLRAHEQRSVEGVLQASEALAALGDLEGAREGLRWAEIMAPADRGLQKERLDAMGARLRAPLEHDRRMPDVLAEPVSASGTWTR